MFSNPLRFVAGCFSGLFVAGLLAVAGYVLLKPAAPLPDQPIHVRHIDPAPGDGPDRLAKPRSAIPRPAPDVDGQPSPAPQNGPVFDAPAPVREPGRAPAPRMPDAAPDGAPAETGAGASRVEPSPAPADRAESRGSEPVPDAAPQSLASLHPMSHFDNVVVRDHGERVAYRGTVELRPTLERIDAGERLEFPDDGAVFQNRERHLPAKPRGYYHEFVVPTQGLSGPGPQRLVVGAGGEVYYSSDHYHSFRRLP